MSDFIDYTHTPHLKDQKDGKVSLLLEYLANGKSLQDTCQMLGFDEAIAKGAILEIAKTWESYFPGDWIAPGEYRTCSQGVHWIPVKLLNCMACTGRNADDKKVGLKVSDMLEKQRYILAERRRLSGVKKLFWLSKEDKEKIEIIEKEPVPEKKKPIKWFHWLFQEIFNPKGLP